MRANETTDIPASRNRGFLLVRPMNDFALLDRASTARHRLGSPASNDVQPSAEGIHAHPGLIVELLDRLARIEAALAHLTRQRTVKEWYTTDEVAAVVGKAPFTVREWCRHGRVNATKRDCGRGNSKEWIISREELMRIQTEGLLPEEAAYRHVR